MFGPTFHEAAEEMEGQAIFGKLNVDEAEEIARRYKVMSIPTVIIFKGGQPVKKSMGVLPKGSLLDMVKDYL